MMPIGMHTTMNYLEMPEFAGGASLVVGGSGGIGAAICRRLAEAGSNVALSYHSHSDTAEFLKADIERGGRRALVHRVDVTDSASVKGFVDSTIEQFGFIHSVVYAAGPALEFAYINEIDPREWARVLNTDVNGCFNVIHAVLPHLRERHHGAIVALVTGAVDRSPPRDILSAAPKAAIQMLLRGVAREEGRAGIRANCVGPGFIEAGLGLTTINPQTKDYVARMARAIPLKRLGKPQDVADVVCFLLSNRASYVTGATIPVAGGLQLA
jgi:NAD(P)-dependent dehydrogenase (short-subunit alcohol dehydrogenase family)